MKICDLHTHSNFSDGSYTPEALINEAKRVGLSAVALCDHNTVSGLSEFLAAGREAGIEAIAGVEFSTDYDGTELHIVGLFINEDKFHIVDGLLAGFVKRKEQSSKELIAALNTAGYSIDYDALKAATLKGYVNRAHVAMALVDKGYVSSVKEAFDTLLGKDCGFYKEPRKLQALDTIEFIKSIGAVAVLAHPFLNLNEDELREFLALAKPHGLDGIETDYSEFDKETTEKATSIAEEFGLLRSGGSDFHGEAKPDIALGFGKGNLCIPYSYSEKLKECIVRE